MLDSKLLRHALDKLVAVKSINKQKVDPTLKDALRREIAILSITSHPRIVSLKGVFEDKNHIHLVMRLMAGGDLYDHLGARKYFDEETAKVIIYRVLDAVRYLHQLGVIHRDLKPQVRSPTRRCIIQSSNRANLPF